MEDKKNDLDLKVVFEEPAFTKPVESKLDSTDKKNKGGIIVEKQIKQVDDCTCTECGSLFNSAVLRQRFGYQIDVSCACHDICVEDVKAICVKQRTVTIPIAGLDGSVGCRGGRVIEGLPGLDNVRVYCAHESLQTTGSNRCLSVNNEVGLEVSLRIPAFPNDIYLVHRFTDTFSCNYNEFFRFPSGVGFPTTSSGREAFRELIKYIDGSCKTIVIEDAVIVDGEFPRVVVTLKVIDKLWKHENLLVSAIRPYFSDDEPSITVSDKFNSLHAIGPCPGAGSPSTDS